MLKPTKALGFWSKWSGQNTDVFFLIVPTATVSPLAVFTNPAEFGTYLRGNDYKCILDFKDAKPIGEAVVLKQEAGETVSIKQKVEITNFPDFNSIKSVSPNSDGSAQRPQDNKVNFNFFLSLHSGVWLIDALQRD